MSQSIPPGLMFRSFLTVASGYVLTHILFYIIALGLGALFFPEFMAYSKLDNAAQEKMMAEHPQAAISVMMFWSMFGLNIAGCLGVGWLTAKTAPFAKFQHGIFLAVLLFIMFLQIVIADPPAKKWMDVIYLGALPIAILLGAKWGNEISDLTDDDSA